MVSRARLALCALALLAACAPAVATTYINGNNGCKEASPGPVKGLKAVATSPSQIKITFKSPPGNPCIEYYLVELVEASNSRSFGEPRKSTQYEVVYSNLKPNTEYRAVVTAVSPAGKSSGASVQARTPADPNACPQSLGPVQALSASASNSKGLLLTSSWKPPANAGRGGNPSACVAGYQFTLLDERGNVLRYEYPFNPQLQLNTGLAYGTRYQVRVAAYPKAQDGGKGPLGPPATVGLTTPPPPPPPCPSSPLPAVVALSSKTELVAAQSLAVRSSWQPPSGVSAACVKEYVWTLVEVSSGAQVAKATTAASQLTWSSSIKPSTKYRTRVVAVSPGGQAGAAATMEFVSGPYATTGRK